MTNRDIRNAKVFVTGANRGIGKAFVQAALKMGAAKVYAGARDPEQLKDLVAAANGKVTPVALDITNAAQIEAAAKLARDMNVLINNAGIGQPAGYTADYDERQSRQEMEVNYFGTLNVTRAFAPLLLEKNGILINVVSVAGLTAFPMFAPYSASKAALHSLTQSLRAELSPGGVFVAGVYPGPIDTDMAKGLEMDKESPEQVALRTYEAIAHGQEDIYPDAFAVEYARALREDAKALEKQNAHMAHIPQSV